MKTTNSTEKRLKKVKTTKTNEIVSRFIKYIFLIAVIIFVINGVYKGYKLGYAIFSNQPINVNSKRVITLYVDENDTAKTVGKELEEENIIKNATVFWIQSIIFECDIIPGTYEVGEAMTQREILELLSTQKQ